eukprot:g32267.t1
MLRQSLNPTRNAGDLPPDTSEGHKPASLNLTAVLMGRGARIASSQGINAHRPSYLSRSSGEKIEVVVEMVNTAKQEVEVTGVSMPGFLRVVPFTVIARAMNPFYPPEALPKNDGKEAEASEADRASERNRMARCPLREAAAVSETFSMKAQGPPAEPGPTQPPSRAPSVTSEADTGRGGRRSRRASVRIKRTRTDGRDAVDANAMQMGLDAKQEAGKSLRTRLERVFLLLADFVKRCWGAMAGWYAGFLAFTLLHATDCILRIISIYFYASYGLYVAAFAMLTPIQVIGSLLSIYITFHDADVLLILHHSSGWQKFLFFFVSFLFLGCCQLIQVKRAWSRQLHSPEVVLDMDDPRPKDRVEKWRRDKGKLRSRLVRRTLLGWRPFLFKESTSEENEQKRWNEISA